MIVYRPPYLANHRVTTSTFLEEFAKYLDNIILAPKLGDTLDLIITDQSHSPVNSPPVPDLLISDHLSVICDLSFAKPPQELTGKLKLLTESC